MNGNKKGGNEFDSKLIRDILKSNNPSTINFLINSIHSNDSLKGFPFNVLVDLKYPSNKTDFNKMEKTIKDVLEAQAKFRESTPKFSSTKTINIPKTEPKPPTPAKHQEIETKTAESIEQEIAESGFYDILSVFTQTSAQEMNIDTVRAEMVKNVSNTEMSLLEFFNYLCDSRRSGLKTAIACSHPYLLEKQNIARAEPKGVIERTYKGNKPSFSYFALVEAALTWDQQDHPISLQNLAMYCIGDPFYETTLNQITMHGHTLNEIISGQAPFSQAMKELFSLSSGDIPKSEVLPEIDCMKAIGTFMGTQSKEIGAHKTKADWAEVISASLRSHLDEAAIAATKSKTEPQKEHLAGPKKGGDLDRD